MRYVRSLLKIIAGLCLFLVIGLIVLFQALGFYLRRDFPAYRTIDDVAVLSGAQPGAEIPRRARRIFILAESPDYQNRARETMWSDLVRVAMGRRDSVGPPPIAMSLARRIFGRVEKPGESLENHVAPRLLANDLDNAFSRDELANIWLNSVWLGRGSYGFSAAAQAYFHKDVGSLDLAETAFLAELPKAPNNYAHDPNTASSRDRRVSILDLAVDQGVLTRQEADLAKAEPIRYWDQDAYSSGSQ